MHKLYLIIGWQENINSSNYQELIKSVEKRYEVVHVDLQEKDHDLFSVLMDRARKQIVGDTSKDIILGFSIGALVAWQLAGEYKFKKMIACSISSILEGDLDLYPQEEVNKIFTPEQIKDLSQTKYAKPLCPTLLLYGSEETKEVIKQSEKLSKKFNGTLLKINGAKHDLSGDYLKEVKRII